MDHALLYGVAVFFATLSIYNFQRLTKIKTLSADSDWLNWVKEYKKALNALTFFSALSAVVLAFYLLENWMTDLLIMSVGLLISILYVIPIKGIRLRDLPFLKSPMIAGVWTMILFVLPWTNEGHNFSELYMEWIAFFCFFFALTIPFDIRDTVYDIPSQKTVPQVFGAPVSKIISIGLLAVYFVITAKINNNMRDHVVFGTICLLIGTLVLLTKKDRSAYYFAAIDASMMVLGCVYFVY